MGRLSISLLGSFQLTLNGLPVTTIESDKGRALLAYLAVEADRPHNREALASLLWPDWPERAARRNLRQSLYNLRRALDTADSDRARRNDQQTATPFLLVTPRQVQFNTASDHWLDVSAFTTLLDACQAHPHRRLDACSPCMDRLQQAVELYRGDFLAGFSLPDSMAFDEWQTLKQEELHRQAVDILTHLPTYYERRRDYEQASRYLQRQLQLEPWREEAHRQLMRVFALSGQRSAALQQYETCRRILVEELGIEPMVGTRNLYQRIKTGDIQPELIEVQNPYQGLQAFTHADAAHFFGREAFTERLFEAVHRQPLVVVVGSSGSGKSSVINAGLLPRLEFTPSSPPEPASEGRGVRWIIAHFRPGSQPFERLAEALVPLLQPQEDCLTLAEMLRQGYSSLVDIAEQILHQHTQASRPSATFSAGNLRAEQRLLVIVDHFEELYALCSDSAIQRAFLDLLFQSDGSSPSHSPYLVRLLSLRADFMGQAMAYRPFADALQDASLALGPMNHQELTRAIEEPARGQGVTFEPGLVERLLDDVGDEPGNLPLLQFALTLLWERRANAQLTHVAYEEMGHMAGALTTYADQAFERLSAAEQEQARRLFLQMVHPGEGTEDTRRLATRAELSEEAWDLVQQLADARLVVTDRDPIGQETVEIVHGALIQGWGRLRAWIDADRAFHIWRGQLRAALRQWDASGRDEGALLRGALLTEAEGWAAARIADLSPQAQEFIEAGATMRGQRLARAEAQRQRELDQAQALLKAEQRRAEAEARASRRLRWLAAGLGLVLLLAIAAAVQAISKGQEARRQASLAVAAQATAQAERTRAEAQVRLALSRQLAAQSVALQDEQLDLALLLNLQAHRLAGPGTDTATYLTSLTLSPYLARFLHGHTDPVHYIAVGPATSESTGGQTLTAVSANGTTIRWDVASGRLISQPIPDQGTEVLAGLSADGQLLAIGQGSSIALWDLTTGQSLGPPLSGHRADVRNLSLNAEGSILVSGSADGTILVWDVAADGARLRAPDQPLTYEGSAVWALSPDGQVLAIAQEEAMTLWNVQTGRPLGPPVTSHPGFGAHSLNFNPDGKTLASSSFDKTVILWDVTKGEALHPPLAGHDGEVLVSAFSPDGLILATGSTDNTIALWDVATGQPLGPPLTGHSDWVRALAFSADGKTLASGSAAGKVILWDVGQRQRLIGRSAQVSGEVATATFDTSGTVNLWQLNREPWPVRACAIANRDLTPAEWRQYLGDQPYQRTCPDLP